MVIILIIIKVLIFHEKILQFSSTLKDSINFREKIFDNLL